VGLALDAQTANTEVRTWLHQIANARVHATTLAVPQIRWLAEREQLLPLPPPYPARLSESSQPPLAAWRTVPPLQHPLSVYDALLQEVSV
jgi:hypothetical protein